MRGHNINLWFVSAVIVGLKILYTWGPQGIYSFHGHGRELRDALIGLYALLCFTHVIFSAVMWTQRSHWDASESATFRFVSVKAVLWGFLALTTMRLNGIPLAYTYLVLVIAGTTIDLDIKIMFRYVWAHQDSATDARQGDVSGTAGAARLVEQQRSKER